MAIEIEANISSSKVEPFSAQKVMIDNVDVTSDIGSALEKFQETNEDEEFINEFFFEEELCNEDFQSHEKDK